MKTITKFSLIVMVLIVSVSLSAQKTYLNNTGTKAPDKQELIQQLHGPTVIVPSSPLSGKAVGDDCTTPYILSTDGNNLPLELENGTTVGTGNNYETTCLNDFDGGNDFIIELTLSVDLTLTFNLDPNTTPYTGFALNETCFEDPTATCLAVSTDTYGTGEAHGFAIALEAGTYYIIVDSWPNSKTTEIADFDLTIDETTTVPNDDCGNAIEIGEVNNLYFSTEEATESTWPGGYIDIFYHYTATVSGNVIISLCDSYFDTELWVFDECGGTDIADDDDSECGFSGLGSTVVLNGVTPGDDFIIMVTGYTDGGDPSDTGFGFLNIYEDNSGCDLVCPASGIAEGEACGDDDNGDCETAMSVSSGDTICGMAWSFDGERDTDWFKFDVTTPGNIKLAVVAEYGVVFGMVSQYEQGVEECDLVQDYFAGFKQIPACVEDSIEFGYLPVGTYYFVVAPSEYDLDECFDYQAAFTFQGTATGTISGTVDDGTKAGIEGVVVKADVFSAVTAANGTYSMDVIPGTYDVTFDGLAAGYGSAIKAGEVVTEGNTTTVDATLSDAAPFLTAAANEDFSWAKLSWTFDKNANGTDIVMGGVEVNNMYTPGATEDINFTLTVFAPFPDDPDYVEYFEITLPNEFTINIASDFPDNSISSTVSADINGQTISWTTNDDYLWYQSFIVYDFTINVTSAGGASGPQICDYLLGGDGYTGYPDSFDGLVTIFEEGGTYVPTYNVYRKLDDNTGNVFIPLVKEILDTELYDVLNYDDYIAAGNWCYYVTINLEDGTESAPSNEVCVEVLDPCGDAIDYGAPGDAAQNATLDYTDQIVWFTFSTPGGDIQISTCGSDFDTQFALYSSCDDVPIYPDMVPDGAVETATDGCDDIGQATIALCSLEGGTYYLAVYGENDEIGEIEVEITKDFQCLTIYDGWGGFSTFIEPSPDDDIEVVLAEMADEMEIAIRQTPYGIWWVPENINTIGKITPVIGYKSKMFGTETTIVTGTEIADKTVIIPNGASYLPVRVPYPTDITELETQLGPDLLLVYNIYNPAELLWPDGEINTLPQLIPDYAYQINVHIATSFTYPASKSANLLTNAAGEHTFYKGANVAWNEVVNTGNTHFISISPEAMTEIMVGDMIGVFNSEGTCVGFVELENLTENNLLNAFGDDAYTVDVMDGLEEGEMMNFKLYRPSTEQEYALEVTWNTSMPSSDGLYAISGLSMISNLKVGPTDISESEFANVSIYPNPTSGLLSINGLSGDANVTVTNAQGQLIYNANLINNSLDMSNQPKGIYFIRISNNDETMIQKVILK